MNILFLTYDLPFPPNSGGKIRAYNLIKGLAKKHSIVLVSYFRNEKQLKFISDLRSFCSKVFVCKRRKTWSPLNILRTSISQLPFAGCVYLSNQFKDIIGKELKTQKYDIVHFESFYPAVYLPFVKEKFKLPKIIMGNENIEYEIYERYVKLMAPQLLRPLLKIDVNKFKKFEHSLWEKANINIAVSNIDAKKIEKVIHKKCIVVPNAIDPELFRDISRSRKPKTSKRQTIGFVGDLNYKQNEEAVRYFLEDILPQIKKDVEYSEFVLVSRSKPKWLESYLEDKQITLLQNSFSSPSDIFGKFDIFVSPIRLCSGTNIKNLEAMAMGIPVVTTPLGIEGLDIKSGKEALVAKDTNEFIKHTMSLLVNERMRRKIGTNAREKVLNFYSWEQSAKILSNLYEKDICCH